jgi:Ni/Fe-hydrogenase subunit HybB-like protein
MDNTKTLEQIQQDAFEPIRRHRFAGKLWIRLLVLLIVLGLFSYITQLRDGLGITAMRDYSAWGLYIGHFVFLVAVSLVGALITAILKLMNISWATPVTRIAEMISVAAVIFAAVTIVIDMGRPDRAHHVIIFARLQSPIFWDVFVINTYLVISALLLYIPMIPDLAMMRDRLTDVPAWQRKMYKVLSINWKGTADQWRTLKRAMKVLMILVLPVAFAIHTVTSWLFAVTHRTGWDSTIFGPYFVSGAFMVGAAVVIVAMYIFRRAFRIQDYLTIRQFNMMGKLLALVSIIYLYFNINEYLVPWYTEKSLDIAHLQALFIGHEAPLFWGTIIIGMIIPIILLLFRKMRAPKPLFIIAVAVVLGAWVKRMLIVIPTQFHPHLPIQNVPSEFQTYVPTWHEMAVTGLTVAGVFMVITILVRLFPVFPIWEVAEEHGVDPAQMHDKNE